MAFYEKSLVLEATDTDGIAQSQNPAGAGNLTLNGAIVSGGVAALDAAMKVTVACTSDETGETFTVTGTDSAGNTISEALAGPNNSSVTSTKYFKTVTQIAVTAAATGVTAGVTSTNGGVSEPIPASGLQPDYKGSFVVELPTGVTATFTVQATLDNPWEDTDAVWVNHDSVVGATATTHDNYITPIRALRLLATATSGTIYLKYLEAN